MLARAVARVKVFYHGCGEEVFGALDEAGFFEFPAARGVTGQGGEVAARRHDECAWFGHVSCGLFLVLK